MEIVNIMYMHNDNLGLNSDTTNSGLLDPTNPLNYTTYSASPFYVSSMDDSMRLRKDSEWYQGGNTKSMFDDDFDVRRCQNKQKKDGSNFMFTYHAYSKPHNGFKSILNNSMELPSKIIMLNIVSILGMFLLYKTILYTPLCIVFVITTIYNIYRSSKPLKTQKHIQLELPL